MKKKFALMLQCFNALNTYCCSNNKLIPDSIYYRYTGNEMLLKSEQKTYKMLKDHEFGCQVIPDMEISTSGLYYFDFHVKSGEKFQKNTPVLVLESFNSKTNERIFWQGFSLADENGIIHFYFEKKGNDAIRVKAYFWNEKKFGLYISNADCHLYRVTKQAEG